MIQSISQIKIIAVVNGILISSTKTKESKLIDSI